MKNISTIFAATVLMFFSHSLWAEDTKPEKANESKEWTGTTGCAKCKFEKETEAKACSAAIKVGENVYLLTGNALKEEMPGCCGKEGEYVVKGVLSTDSKSIEVKELKKK